MKLNAIGKLKKEKALCNCATKVKIVHDHRGWPYRGAACNYEDEQMCIGKCELEMLTAPGNDC